MRLEELFVTVLNRSITAGYVVIAVMRVQSGPKSASA